jgi:hypothetical protein
VPRLVETRITFFFHIYIYIYNGSDIQSPTKKDLLQKLHSAFIFSKFDMKSGFWQIQIDPKDRYKTAFTVSFGQYEWNVMPFDLKNTPSEFQRIMNDIFNAHSKFCIVYIEDVLFFHNP